MASVAGSTEVKDRNDERALSVLPGGTTRGLTAMYPLLPRASYGSGCRLFGEDGRAWWDLNNNFTALILGHAHPDVVRVLREAVERGSSFGLPTLAEVEMAEALVARVPWAEQVRFCNSGTEAVFTAVRAARAVTQRPKIVVQRPAYHGAGDALLPAEGDGYTRGVPTGVTDDTVIIPTGDAAALHTACSMYPDQIAAVLLDVAPSRAGLRPLSHEFVSAARALTTSIGALLVVDEVVTFRASVSGMATGHFAVTPDLLAVGKIIGGGLPIGAVVGARKIMYQFDPREEGFVFHGGTFSGNPLSMSAGQVALRVYDDDAIERLNRLGARLRSEVNAAINPIGWEATGYSSVLKIVPTTADLADDWRVRLWWAAEQRELLLTPGTMLACLSTPMDERVVAGVAERIIESVVSVSREPAP
jgi:glutamate-1-semialdehyde 2,1-aminomutase